MNFFFFASYGLNSYAIENGRKKYSYMIEPKWHTKPQAL